MVEHVKPTDLVRYVRAHGWTPVDSVSSKGGYEFYSPPRPDDAGRAHRIGIPRAQDARDLRDIAQEVIGISAAIERRDVSEVVADILSVAIDVVDIRILPFNGGSRIPLSSAPDVYSSVLDLFTASAAAEKAAEKAAAKAAQNGRGSTIKPVPVPDGDLWLLPAVPRSFAFRIESVVPSDTEEMYGAAPRAPIVHKAVCRVVKGLQQSSVAAKTDRWDDAERVITAPMCQALLKLHTAVNGSEIEFSHALSPKYAAPANVNRVGSLRYTVPMATQLMRLQSSLSGVPPTMDTLAVLGTIVGLTNRTSPSERAEQLALGKREHEYDPHKVVHVEVTGPRGVKIRHLYFSLWEKEYRDACRAHATGTPIEVSGKPTLVGGKWALDPVYSFSVLKARRKTKS